MAQDIMKSLEESGAPAREFWEDDLVSSVNYNFPSTTIISSLRLS